MIEITTDATVGIRIGRRLTPKTRTDGPFETDAATEAMLVAEGHATYVDGSSPTQPAGQDGCAPARLDRLRKPQLLELAAEKGLYSGDSDGITVPKLLELLMAADNPPSDGRVGGNSTQETENGGAAATGDEGGQSGETGPEAAGKGPESADGGDSGPEGVAQGDEGGNPEDGDVPPVIDAAGVVE